MSGLLYFLEHFLFSNYFIFIISVSFSTLSSPVHLYFSDLTLDRRVLFPFKFNTKYYNVTL